MLIYKSTKSKCFYGHRLSCWQTGWVFFCNKMENKQILYGFELKLVSFEQKNVGMNNIWIKDRYLNQAVFSVKNGSFCMVLMRYEVVLDENIEK